MSGTTLLNIETALGSLGRSSSSAPVILGGITLTGVEVPSALRVGGEHNLVVHKLVGGARVIQAMGNDPARQTLAGLFTGPNAQARALSIEQMRAAGSEIAFSAAGLSQRVRIASFWYTYQEKGAVIPYELALEIQPAPAVSATASLSALSDLVGPDITSGIQSISSTVATVSAYAETAIGQVQTVIGQVAPVANLVGAGSLLAGVSDNLTAASGIATAGTNFAAIPAAASSMISGLQSAGTSLMSTISQAGGNLTGIQAAAPVGSLFSDAGSLQAQIASAGALSGAVQAGAYVNRAATNTALAAGIATTAPVVYA